MPKGLGTCFVCLSTLCTSTCLHVHLQKTGSYGTGKEERMKECGVKERYENSSLQTELEFIHRGNLLLHSDDVFLLDREIFLSDFHHRHLPLLPQTPQGLYFVWLSTRYEWDAINCFLISISPRNVRHYLHQPRRTDRRNA